MSKRNQVQREYVRDLNKELHGFRLACQPQHARFMEYGEVDWFKACDRAFQKAMREHHPERER